MSPTTSPLALASRLNRGLFELIFPPACVDCGGAVPAGSPAPALCEGCRQQLTARGPACLRCAANLGPNLDPDGCARCRKEGFRFERVVRLGVYKDRLRSACLQVKRPGREPLATALAECLWDLEAEALHSALIDLVIPVPRHWWERWQRGLPAPSILAEVFGRHLRCPVLSSGLRKIRHTLPQAGLPPTHRRTNVRGAFATGRGIDLTGASVLLVDDVLTTGTTADECSRMLRTAGAAHVTVAVLARGLGREPVPPTTLRG